MLAAALPMRMGHGVGVGGRLRRTIVGLEGAQKSRQQGRRVRSSPQASSGAHPPYRVQCRTGRQEGGRWGRGGGRGAPRRHGSAARPNGSMSTPSASRTAAPTSPRHAKAPIMTGTRGAIGRCDVVPSTSQCWPPTWETLGDTRGRGAMAPPASMRPWPWCRHAPRASCLPTTCLLSANVVGGSAGAMRTALCGCRLCSERIVLAFIL